jgi:hypothetical protein
MQLPCESFSNPELLVFKYKNCASFFLSFAYYLTMQIGIADSLHPRRHAL